DRVAHHWQQASQGVNVRLTVGEEVVAFLQRVGAASLRQLSHLVLRQFVYPTGQAKEGQGAEQAVTTGRRQSRREKSELGVQVEDEARQGPAQRQEAAQLRAGQVGDEQGQRAGVERRLDVAAQVILPEADEASRPQLTGHQAERRRPLARWLREL